MNLGMKKGRPVPHGAAPSKKHTTDTLPAPAELLNGVFVVLVARPVAGQLRYRRSVYFNLPAAQRAQDRAVMRGQKASITLCRLTPAHEFVGGWNA